MSACSMSEYLWLFRSHEWGTCPWRCRWRAAASLRPFGLIYQSTNWSGKIKSRKKHFSHCLSLILSLSVPMSHWAPPDETVCWCVCSHTQKQKFYSLLSLDGVHRSNIIAGNVTSSTSGERARLPPVALAGSRRTERDQGTEAGRDREGDKSSFTHFADRH